MHSVLLINLDLDFRFNHIKEITPLKVGYIEKKEQNTEKKKINKNNITKKKEANSKEKNPQKLINKKI